MSFSEREVGESGERAVLTNPRPLHPVDLAPLQSSFFFFWFTWWLSSFVFRPLAVDTACLSVVVLLPVSLGAWTLRSSAVPSTFFLFSVRFSSFRPFDADVFFLFCFGVGCVEYSYHVCGCVRRWISVVCCISMGANLESGCVIATFLVPALSVCT